MRRLKTDRKFIGGAYNKGDSFNIAPQPAPLTREEHLENVIQALTNPSEAVLAAVRYYNYLPYRGLTLWQLVKMWWTGKWPL